MRPLRFTSLWKGGRGLLLRFVDSNHNYLSKFPCLKWTVKLKVGHVRFLHIISVMLGFFGFIFLCIRIILMIFYLYFLVEKQLACCSTIFGNICDSFIFEFPITGKSLFIYYFWACFLGIALGCVFPFYALRRSIWFLEFYCFRIMILRRLNKMK